MLQDDRTFQGFTVSQNPSFQEEKPEVSAVLIYTIA